jgi:tubulin epsilon
MRETITVQVGQCGNQIGNQFWDLLLKEHEHSVDSELALSSFFKYSESGGRHSKKTMKARALLIDMECGPLQQTMKGHLGHLFDDTQFVMDVYGSGNNFAHGHMLYGPKYRDKFEEGIRKNAEQCDSLQTFLVTHSLGGGTGSGVGTYVLGLLEDMYPEVYRFSACVFPSADDDVITSPYNAVLASRCLIDHSDCVLPIDNHALQEFAGAEAAQLSKAVGKLKDSRAGLPAQSSAKRDYAGGAADKGFNEMNNVAARMLCHLTSSSRFHGDMNVDMNEICTNLIPFPHLKFLMTALSIQRPVSGSEASASGMQWPLNVLLCACYVHCYVHMGCIYCQFYYTKCTTLLML